MSIRIPLTDAQKCLANTVREHKENQRLSIRFLSRRHKVPRTTLQCACKTDRSYADIIDLIDGRDGQQRLSYDEENLIVQAALEFQNNGTLLCRDALKALSRSFLQTFSFSRRQYLDFKYEKLSKGWVARLLSSFPDLSLKTR